MAELSSASFACPRCGSALKQTSSGALFCPLDCLQFVRIDRVWRMLLPEREPVYSAFIQEYETVRRAEGRGSQQAEYYRALPYRDLSGRRVSDWHIRAASFSAFLERIVQPVEAQSKRPLNVLDLGAGCGWLSNRLAARGHCVAAVDLIVNDFDGLGCCQFYETAFTPVQAEFDHLPFAQKSFDLVIFNASLHYSTGYETTLRETLRVLDPAGQLVVLDSPVYLDASSGRQMVGERQRQYVKQYGFPSNALPSENYLTYQRLDELCAALHLHGQVLTPYYGLRWALRPWKARLLGQREPAKFHVVVLSKIP
jgi:SAM-dependent methyltransferase